ncbi:hypothetical protein DFH07DRAFT_774936 [Mycena maculata]|uniref:Uncharacterized protein n=1 Tax=Mycena maculata TaxID=230809 RepID=A0AAD7IWT2_9AGAR|nr:hypothetical protein DFH07DRAFT_774936 [Mycena maculata]
MHEAPVQSSKQKWSQYKPDTQEHCSSHIDALEMGTSEKVARNEMEEKAKISSCVSLETRKYYQTRRDGHITEGSKIQKQHGAGNKDIEWGVAGDSEISPLTICVHTTSKFQT